MGIKTLEGKFQLVCHIETQHATATSPEDAGQALPFTCVCPYLAPCSALDKPQFSLFILPFSKRWWVEMPQEQPDQTGMQKGVVFVTDEPLASSSWLHGEVLTILEIPLTTATFAPTPRSAPAATLITPRTITHLDPGLYQTTFSPCPCSF
jgi:hypothetical protein